MRVTIAVALLALTACSSIKPPALQPPDRRLVLDVEHDLADCEAASSPGFGAYAKAAGEGLLAQVVAPFAGIAMLVIGGASTQNPPQTAEKLGQELLFLSTFGAVIGVVAGPVIAAGVASDSVGAARQAKLEHCLRDRGYAVAPAEPADGLPEPEL
jgi:hypothetical protein